MLGGAESEQPHLVITSHCFLSQILSMARQQGGFFVRIETCNISIHIICVTTEFSGQSLSTSGLRIEQSGR